MYHGTTLVHLGKAPKQVEDFGGPKSDWKEGGAPLPTSGRRRSSPSELCSLPTIGSQRSRDDTSQRMILSGTRAACAIARGVDKPSAAMYTWRWTRPFVPTVAGPPTCSYRSTMRANCASNKQPVCLRSLCVPAVDSTGSHPERLWTTVTIFSMLAAVMTMSS